MRSFYVICALCLLSSPLNVYANASTCKERFRAKEYKQAAECFMQLADAIKPQKSTILRFRKGRLLRNAALCLKQAAKRTKRPQEARYLREVGLGILSQYLKEQLYEIPLRKTQAKTLVKQFRKGIEYASLRLKTRNATSICLRGYRYKACQQAASWEGPLRPGEWELRVTFPNKATVVKKLQLAPKSTKTLSFQQPRVKVPVFFDAEGQEASFALSGEALQSTRTHKGKYWRLKLLPGRYKLIVHLRQTKWVRQFVVYKGKPFSLKWQAASPGLFLTSSPSFANVYVDGVRQGATPLRILLSVGSHHIRLKSPCYREWHKTLKRPSGADTIQATLQPGAALQAHLAYVGIAGSQRTLGVATLIAGGAILLFGAAGQITASVYHDEANNTQEQFNDKPVAELANTYQEQASNGNLWRTIGSVGLGIGGLGIGLGILRMATVPLVKAPPTQCRFE